MLTILYFASLREALGTDREIIARPQGVETIGHLRAWLRNRDAVWAQALAEGRAVRMAVDQVMAREDTPIGPSAEIAFFPPVTGG